MRSLAKLSALTLFALGLLLAPVPASTEKIVLPAPTAADLAAPPGPEARPMEVREAKIAMGWVPVLASHPLGGMSEQKIAIFDVGFRGLHQWLAAHPNEQARTSYIDDPGPQSADEPDHGFKVYRVARAVLGDAQLMLYRVRNGTDFVHAVADAAGRGVVIANASIGIPLLDVAEPDDLSFGEEVDKLLRRHEMFVFFAVGNARQKTHTWRSSERGGDGMVVLRDPAPSPEEAKVLHIDLPAGSSLVYLSWDFRHAHNADYQLELATPDGRTLATARAGKKPGSIVLDYRSPEASAAVISIRRLTGPASGVLMRLQAGRGITVGPGFNGLQTAWASAYEESPFAIFVGSMGKTVSGKLAPSAFSDIGREPDGALIPHILGPGQLIVDGKEYDGTSFATPFVTAAYGATFGFNYKNLIERTATLAPLDPSVPAFARSRWGVPDVMQKLFTPEGQINITGPTKVEDVSHRIVGDSLVVHFRISRCCMEALTWYAGASLYDPKGGKWVMDATGKTPLVAFATLHSDKKDYVREPVAIRFPLRLLAAYKGQPLDLKFGIAVRSWMHAAVRGYAASHIKVDEAPTYQIIP